MTIDSASRSGGLTLVCDVLLASGVETVHSCDVADVDAFAAGTRPGL